MSKTYYLAASILSADFSRLGEDIRAAEAAGADWIHVDVMDGHFVPNLTMGPVVVEACRRVTALPLDVHLMIENPEHFLEAFSRAGATGLTVHAEVCPQLGDVLRTIRDLGCKPGVALNPATPASAIEPVLPLADLVLAMTVNPGYSGQSFMPEVLPKVKVLRAKLDEVNPSALVEVDGGINAQTLPLTRDAGAQVFVAASAVFEHKGGTEAGVKELKGVIRNA